MNVEQLEIREYLAKCAPLNMLPAEQLDELAQGVEVLRIPANTQVLQVGDSNQRALLIRHGAVELTEASGDLYARSVSGEWVGFRSAMRGGKVQLNVRTLEDTLAYAIPGQAFAGLLQDHQRIADFFSDQKADRLRNAIRDIRGCDDYSMISLRVGELMKLPVLVSQSDSVRQVAQQMGEVNAKTAMITGADCNLCGIVTDADFRKRVVATGLDVNQPVAEIMTHQPLTLSPQHYASEALLLMARRNIHHVPVLENDEIVGVISASDLLRGQSHNAIYLVGDIFAAKDANRLTELSKSLPKVMLGMVRQSLPAHDIGQAVTSIGQAITRRLLTLAEERFGPPPVPYAFIVAGSMARREQTAHSDQDNGMILSDDYKEAEHGEYFRNIAKFVSDALDACGYIYCPGNIMATNDQWRQPLSVWRGYFTRWIDNPEPKALMYASIFFDLRCLHGEDSLLKNLQAEILGKTREQSLFQAYMAGNALSHRPPIGFFRGFVLDKSGSDEKGMDMKKRGVVPVIDLARVYALAGGLPAINTWERLQQVGEAGLITQNSINDLRDAFEFISMVRLQHQAKQIENGQAPNNYMPPEELSSLERRHLKDAFEVISTLQESMANRYQADRFR